MMSPGPALLIASWIEGASPGTWISAALAGAENPRNAAAAAIARMKTRCAGIETSSSRYAPEFVEGPANATFVLASRHRAAHGGFDAARLRNGVAISTVRPADTGSAGASSALGPALRPV